MTQLRAAGEPLHLMSAEALVRSRATAERLQQRVYQLEAIARLNGETIRGMQRATAEAESVQWSARVRSAGIGGKAL